MFRRSLLTSSLITSLIASLFCLSSVQANSLTPESSTPVLIQASEPQAHYLSELKQLYLTQDKRQALSLHLNDLLAAQALRAEYQLKQKNRYSLTYSVSYTEPAQLNIRREKRYIETGATQVSTEKIAVFGIDPAVTYHCAATAIHCDFFLAHSHTPLLSTLRDSDSAQEISKALSALIRSLQKD